MKTDYNKINSFEAAVVATMFVGFLLVGVIVFSGLTPRQQAQVSTAFEIFDIHEQATETAIRSLEAVKFVFEVSDEFYNQFYTAFEQVASLPVDDFETPLLIAQNINSFIYDLSEQVAANYKAQSRMVPTMPFIPEVAQAASESRVLGAVLDLTANIPEFLPEMMTAPLAPSTPNNEQESLKVHYEFAEPNMEAVRLGFTKFINNINNTHLGRAW